MFGQPVMFNLIAVVAFISLALLPCAASAGEAPVSRVEFIDRVNNEIQVLNPGGGRQFSKGDRLFVKVSGGIVVFKVTTPMLNQSRCSIVQGKESFGRVIEGMPVYRESLKGRIEPGEKLMIKCIGMHLLKETAKERAVSKARKMSAAEWTVLYEKQGIPLDKNTASKFVIIVKSRKPDRLIEVKGDGAFRDMMIFRAEWDFK